MPKTRFPSPLHNPFGWHIAHQIILSHGATTHAPQRSIHAKAATSVRCFDFFQPFHRVNVKVRTHNLVAHFRHDPRKHTLTAVFTAHAVGEPVGMDDAEEARIFGLDELPESMAFDHRQILNDYRRFVETGLRPSPVDR